jgi:hypothetical protein
MENKPVFISTAQELLPVLQELRQREPIFHSAEFGNSTEDYERSMTHDYWEVGASGRRYSRQFILRQLKGKPVVYADTVGWRSWDHALRQLGTDTYLLTYTLQQGERITRRSTIWRKEAHGWSIVYHQGTTVVADEDDTSTSCGSKTVTQRR